MTLNVNALSVASLESVFWQNSWRRSLLVFAKKQRTWFEFLRDSFTMKFGVIPSNGSVKLGWGGYKPRHDFAVLLSRERCEIGKAFASWLRCCSVAEHVLHSDFQPGQPQRQSAHLLGESWPTDHRHIYWSLARQTEGCGLTEWWTHWTVVLIIWFICCRVLM